MNNLKKTDKLFHRKHRVIWFAVFNDILDTFVYFLCEYFKLSWESIWKYLS